MKYEAFSNESSIMKQEYNVETEVVEDFIFEQWPQE